MSISRKRFLKNAAFALAGICFPYQKILGSNFLKSENLSTTSLQHHITIYRAQQDMRCAVRSIVKRKSNNI